jgi:hypothetical protein
MEQEKLVPAAEFCLYHHIELSFIDSLIESGLITITYVEENIFLPASQLRELEKLIRFNQDLGINVEGIETVTYLLHRIDEMQKQIALLKDKVALYEEG